MSTSTTKTAKVTMSDVIESLNGYEEAAIAEAFKAVELSDLSSLQLPRALIFIEEKRTGKSDAEAYEAAMVLRVKDITERFVDDDEAEAVLEGDDPVTDAGKSTAAPAAPSS